MYRNTRGPLFLRSRYRYCWIIISITSYTCFHLRFFSKGFNAILNPLFYNPESIMSKDMDEMMMLKHAGFLLVVCLFMTLGNVTMPVAGGAIGGLMSIGALCGNFLGHGLRYYGHINFEDLGHLSMCGAAAMVSTTTRFLALSLVVIESTQNMDLTNKLFITTIFCFGVASLLSKSFTYSVIEMRRLPYVHKLFK